MEYAATIQTNLAALKRFVVTLFIMAGLAAPGASHKLLPRNRRKALLALLRPVESAVRRLIIIAAQDFVAPPLRARKMTPPKYVQSVIAMHGGVLCRLAWKAGAQFPTIIPLSQDPKDRAAARLSFPLFDPLRRIGQRRWVKQTAEPRIWGGSAGTELPPERYPERFDEVDTTCIGLRLAAVGRALDDLPRHALRYARWKARRDHAINEPGGANGAGRQARFSPLRSGRPPGARRHGPNYLNPLKFERSPAREIDDILTDLHNLARRALAGHAPITGVALAGAKSRDTS